MVSLKSRALLWIFQITNLLSSSSCTEGNFKSKSPSVKFSRKVRFGVCMITWKKNTQTSSSKPCSHWQMIRCLQIWDNGRSNPVIESDIWPDPEINLFSCRISKPITFHLYPLISKRGDMFTWEKTLFCPVLECQCQCVSPRV